MSGPKLFQPLLSATVETPEDRKSIRFPVMASAKIDGIRCVIHPTIGPCTRTLKPIPNEHIRRLLNPADFPLLKYLDGEITVGPPEDVTKPGIFNATQSAVMSQGGTPEFTYWVFDHCGPVFQAGNTMCPFTVRFADASTYVIRHNRDNAYHGRPGWIELLPHQRLDSLVELNAFEEVVTAAGAEGVMLRDPGGRYKLGRSTLKQGTLLKIKQWADDEAVITGYEPLMRNRNAQTTDIRGYAKRSSHQANLVADDTMVGKLLLRGLKGRWAGVSFSCGSGLDDDLRRYLRTHIDGLVKAQAICTYKYIPYGSLEAPRHPIFKGIRDIRDIILDANVEQGLHSLDTQLPGSEFGEDGPYLKEIK